MTDTTGRAVFTDLPIGVYLITETGHPADATPTALSARDIRFLGSVLLFVVFGSCYL